MFYRRQLSTTSWKDACGALSTTSRNDTLTRHEATRELSTTSRNDIRVPTSIHRAEQTTGHARGIHQQLFAGRRSGLQSSWSNICTRVHTYFRNMPKKSRSANQQEKRREQSRLRIENFLIKKDNERLARDMAARQAALEKLGINQTFDFEDHNEIYRFADHRAPINQPPMEIIDGTVSPPAVTSYPEYPVSEYSTKPAFNVHVERAVPRPSLQRSTNALPVIFERAVRKPLCRCISRLSSDKRFNERKCAMRAVAPARSKIQDVHSKSSSCSSSSSSWAAARIQARICLRFACLMSRTPPVRVSQWRVSAASNNGPPVTGSKLSVSTLIRPSTGEPLARPGA